MDGGVNDGLWAPLVGIAVLVFYGGAGTAASLMRPDHSFTYASHQVEWPFDLS